MGLLDAKTKAAIRRGAWFKTVNDPIPEHLKPQMYPGAVSLEITKANSLG
jgi:hypothetical protein